MRRLILGTAGHIDHGKTALVRALTGVDTDRLKEEKARGITIELGFAELDLGPDLRCGVVDVPGHEGFVRAMVAGATGMDLVLLVVAADEGVMPQTREHLAIVRLLGVERLAVALTKADLVEGEWLDLVLEEVHDLLADSPYADAPIVPTSAETGAGLTELVGALKSQAEGVRGRDSGDVLRLPIDRVFTVRGTGTVVTGTLWSGTLTKGQRLRVEPDGPEARVRGLEVHGTEHGSARAGARTAVALVGPDVGRGGVIRGQCLVSEWPPSWMLTVQLVVLPDTGWEVEHGQRVRVHAGTAEALARCIIPTRLIPPGGTDWVQLRLEEPIVARARDPLIIRSYSPVTTIGGALVVEPHPQKRSRFSKEEAHRFELILQGQPEEALGAALAQAGWMGLAEDRVPVATGMTPDSARSAVSALEHLGAICAGGRVFAPEIVRRGSDVLVEAANTFHVERPLERGIPLEILRQSLPRVGPPALAEAVIQRLERDRRIDVHEGRASVPGFEVRLTTDAEQARARLRDLYRSAGVSPPTLKELPEDLRSRRDLEALLRLLVDQGELSVLDQGLFVWSDALQSAVSDITRHFGGRNGLTPADFREVVPVSRKHLMPLLGFLDGLGITNREGDTRSVRSEAS
jgi:selenocysteine-specific elongation factor